MLQKIPIEVNTPEWLELRTNYIGCSDIPILTGSNRNYGSPIDVFYQKIGLGSGQHRMAERPFMGHIHEPIILDLWQYWEEGKEKYVENYMEKKRIRPFIKNDGYILVNEDIPFLSCTPDGTIPKGEKRLDGYELEKDAPLQVKNIDSLKWDSMDGYIPEHHEQVHGEMMVFGTEYAELACLKGGNELHINQVPYVEEFSKSIMAICSHFWYERVLPARPLAKRLKLTSKKADKEAIQKDIMELEPLPDDSDAYRAFLSARFQNQDNPDRRIIASPPMETLMHTYQYYNDIQKEIKKKQVLIKNTLLRVHEHNGITLILGDGCRSSMNKKHVVSGKEMTAELIRNEINKLN